MIPLLKLLVAMSMPSLFYVLFIDLSFSSASLVVLIKTNVSEFEPSVDYLLVVKTEGYQNGGNSFHYNEKFIAVLPFLKYVFSSVEFRES